MSIFTNNLSIQDLIRITTGGVQVATFADIRDTLIKTMKSIYGNDIDLDSATADGQWINQIALIINNCLQCVKYAYDQLDPASAQGSFLDTLCSYNNVFRKNMTNSIAQLYVKNISGVKQDNVQSILFLDKNNTEWLWTNDKNEISWEIDDVKLLKNVTCQTMGNIIALGSSLGDVNNINWDNITEDNCGSINKTVEFGKWQIYQQSDAIPGSDEESDESLRSRRVQALGNQSVSVLSGLSGALLNTDGIKDVFIYNAVAQTTMADTTVVPAHSIYVCVKYDDYITDDTIGQMIYNKLTPGIPTKQFTPVAEVTNYSAYHSGDSKEYEIKYSSALSYKIYWKKCKPYQFADDVTRDADLPADARIKIDLNLLTNNFDFVEGYDDSEMHNAITDVEKSIVQKLLNYLNNIKINEDCDANNILLATQQGDILKNGLPTFFVKNVDLADADTDGILNLCNTYMEFKEEDIYFSIYKNTNSTYSTGTIYIVQ